LRVRDVDLAPVLDGVDGTTAVRLETPLRQALDVIVDSRARAVAVVDDTGQIVGMLTIEQIAAGMAKE
jgi:CBS domain-containing protein